MIQRILIWFIALAAPVAAQETPQAPSAAVFRSTSRMVQISVVAQNRNGQPVRDLRQDELQVLDDGVSQGLGYRDEFIIPAGAAELKLPFANPTSGRIGALSIPLAEVANRFRPDK